MDKHFLMAAESIYRSLSQADVHLIIQLHREWKHKDIPISEQKPGVFVLQTKTLIEHN